jgi:beta-mannosidase
VPLIPLTPQERFVAHASNAVFKADATYAAPAGEVRAVNAISAIFYG